mgnify:CR=1 FL=1
MKQDIEFLYSKNKRLTKKAYDYLLNNQIERFLLEQIAASNQALIDIDNILQIISYHKKIKDSSEPPPILEIQQQVYKDLHSQQKEFSLLENQERKHTAQGKEQSFQSHQGKKFGLEVKEVKIIPSPSFKPIAKEYSPSIKVFEQTDISNKSNSTGSVENFISYFRDRFEQQQEILKNRQSVLPILRLDELSKHVGSEARIIGMVYDKKTTSKGNLVFELEDEYSHVRVVVPSNEQCFKEAQRIVRDDVIAFDGKILENFFIVKAVHWPDVSVLKSFPQGQEDLAIVYLSDLHFGSKHFLEKAFKRFLHWLEGRESQQSLASKVKYIIIAGDLVDGIGVYPTQENDLVLKDIHKQYKEFENALEKIPDYISVIIGPGNHDGVRRAEPQPAIDKDLVEAVDVIRIGSPCMVQIENFNHLIYHGTSLDSIIANIPGLSYAKPEDAMKEILKRRHLSPIYGENLIVPELKDFMTIPQEPDVLHMGHVHKNACAKYRGVLMINSGTYQDRTEYQIRMGHTPTPAITPVFELKSGQVYHLRFLEEELL